MKTNFTHSLYKSWDLKPMAAWSQKKTNTSVDSLYFAILASLKSFPSQEKNGLCA